MKSSGVHREWAPLCLFPFLLALVPLRVETRIPYVSSVLPPAQVPPSFRRTFRQLNKDLSEVADDFYVFLGVIGDVAAFSVGGYEVYGGAWISYGEDYRVFVKLNML